MEMFFLYPIDIFYIEIIKKFFTSRGLQVETGIVYSEILCNQCSQWKLTNVNHSNPLQVEQF